MLPDDASLASLRSYAYELLEGATSDASSTNHKSEASILNEEDHSKFSINMIKQTCESRRTYRGLRSPQRVLNKPQRPSLSHRRCYSLSVSPSGKRARVASRVSNHHFLRRKRIISADGALHGV